MQHRALDLHAQPVDDGLQLEALVVRGQLELGELAKDDGFLLLQHARQHQLGQHALNLVGVLAHIFQEQNAAVDLRKIRRTQQGHQHRQIAAPQRGAARHIKILELGLAIGQLANPGHLPASTFALPAEQVFKAVQHDVVHGLARLFDIHAKVSIQCGACPGGGTCLRQHGQLEGGEVAQAHESGAIGDGLGHRLVFDARQDAREAVATPRDQRHIGAAGCSTVNGRKTGSIIARKALAAGECIRINFHLMAQRFKLLDAALESGLVTHRTRWGVDIDVLGTMAVVMTAAAAVGAMHMVMMVVVLMAAMLVMHMVCMAAVVGMRVLMGVRVIVQIGAVLLGGCWGFARGCQSLFMQPLAACSVK